MMSLGPAVCSHFRLCTTALASAWQVLGFLSTNSTGAYRQHAGIGPPKTSCVPLSVRVSLMIFTSPFCSSMVITGSVLLMASIWPERSAASAPEDVPTPTKLTSLGCRPARESTRFAIVLVDEPGADTPIFLPFRSLSDL